MDKDLFSLANMISYSRILLALFLPFIFESIYLVALVVALAGISDILDGYIARLRGTTRLGRIIDPAADKIFVTVFIVLLFIKGHIPYAFLPMVLLREIAILLGGLIFFRIVLKKKYLLKARWPGKVVTVLQFIVAAWAYLHLPYLPPVIIFVGLASVVAIVDYFYVFKDG